MGNNILKYIFVIIVIALIGFGIFKMQKDEEEEKHEIVDQTSKATNIQTDLRLAICNFDTLNPILSNNRNVQEITKMIFEPLVTLNESYKMQYCLAEEIAKTDDLNYVITLKKDICWQDGSKFTANDVKFTVDKIMDPNINSVYKNNLKGLEALTYIDDYTLKMTLSYPIDFFAYHLTFPILSKDYYGEDDFANTDKNIAPMGTGLFKIATVDSNIIKLEKNNYYWNTDKNPMAKEININLYNSAGEVYNAFKNGEIDILDVKIANVEEYIGSIGYKKTEYKSREYDFLAFNTATELFSDPAVRQALSKGLDKNNIVASCLGNGYVVSNFSLDMGNWLYTRDLNIEPNADEAKQILLQAGWEYKNNRWKKKINNKNVELSFTLAVNGNNQKRIAVAENIKNQLANLGIFVTIKQVNNDSYSDMLQNKNFDVILTGMTCGYSPSVATFFGEENLANYSNDQIKEIMQIISNTSDENALYDNYNKLYDIYLSEAPYIGLYRSTDQIIYNQSLVGNIKPNAFNLYYNIEKWYRQ